MTMNAILQTLIGDAQAAIDGLNTTLTDIATQQEATTLIPADPDLIQDPVVQGIENGIIYNRVRQTTSNTVDNKYKNSFKLPNANIDSVFTPGTLITGNSADIQVRVKQAEDMAFSAWQTLDSLSSILFNAIEFLSDSAFELLAQIRPFDADRLHTFPIANVSEGDGGVNLGTLSHTVIGILFEADGPACGFGRAGYSRITANGSAVISVTTTGSVVRRFSGGSEALQTLIDAGLVSTGEFTAGVNLNYVAGTTFGYAAGAPGGADPQNCYPVSVQAWVVLASST